VASGKSATDWLTAWREDEIDEEPSIRTCLVVQRRVSAPAGTAGEVPNPGGNTIGGAPGTGTWIVCGPPWRAELDCLLGVYLGAWPVLTVSTMVVPGALDPVMLWFTTVPWVVPLAWLVSVTLKPKARSC